MVACIRNGSIAETNIVASGSYTMWAYSNLPNQTVLSEAVWLKAFFSLSLVANAFSTCTVPFLLSERTVC